MGDRFADLVHIHGRLGRDAAVGVAHPKGLLAAPFRLRRDASPPTRAGLVDKRIRIIREKRLACGSPSHHELLPSR